MIGEVKESKESGIIPAIQVLEKCCILSKLGNLMRNSVEGVGKSIRYCETPSVSQELLLLIYFIVFNIRK